MSATKLNITSIGIVREVDELGRVVLPKEIRTVLGIAEGDPLEIFHDETAGIILLRKYRAEECLFCKDTGELFMFKGFYVCSECITGSSPAQEIKRGRPSDSLERHSKALQEFPKASQKKLTEILNLSQGRISQLLKEIGAITR